MSQAELAKSLRVDATTLSRNLQPLRRKKLIMVGVASDNRTKQLRLSPTGSQTVQALESVWSKTDAAVRRKLAMNSAHAIENQQESEEAVAKNFCQQLHMHL